MSTRQAVDVLIPILDRGGVETVLVSIANGLAERGYRVRALTFDPEGAKVKDLVNVEILSLGNDAYARATALLQLARAMRRPDAAPVMLSAMFSWNVTALIARSLSRSRCRVVVSDHNHLLPRVLAGDRRAALVRRIMQLMYPFADAIVAVSDGVAEETATLGPRVAERLVTIHNPVVDQLLEAKIAGTEQHPWLDDPNTKVVVALSRLVPVKNYALLLDAFAKADGLNGTAKLVIIGDGPEKGRLADRARALGLDARVDLVGARANPMALLKKADLFVHSSDREGFGLVIVEALAAGVPVVATNCRSGPAEILGNGRYGELVPVGDSDSLAAAIDCALSNPPMVDVEALDRFRIERIVDSYERVLFARQPV